MKHLLLIGIASASIISHCTAETKIISKDSHDIQVTTYAKGLNKPWGMTFLPDGKLLVTEKEGTLRLISTQGELSEAIDVPLEIDTRGQGGLLDVALDPQFLENRRIYISYAKPAENRMARTAVAKAKLETDKLTDTETIWQQNQPYSAGYHYGSRLVFDRSGHLFVTLGDRGGMDNAQDMQTHFGKIVRIDTDGQPATDNPFLNQKGVLTDIYSSGHRNVQGAYLHPETGVLWANEHGPKGGDEINIIEAGKNYGWPLITYGVNYNGSVISDKTHMPGMQQPVHYWNPSIATSGMLIYSGDQFPNWKGNVFTGALKLRHLNRIQLDDNNKVIAEERLLKEQNSRIRDIEQGPNGYIYVATDSSDGKILKLTPIAKN